MMKRLLIIFTVTVLLFTCSCSNLTTKTAVYAAFNDEAITTAEIEYFNKRNKAEIINRFSSEYEIDDYSAFWTTEYGGICPVDELEKASFDDAVRAKAELCEMVKNGIYESADFDYFITLAEEYSGEAGGVGLTSISRESFYTYYIQNGEMKLKDILNMTDEQYESYIDSIVSSANIIIEPT